MDSLTARHLARELDARWRGRRLDACLLDRSARALTIAVEGAAVRFDLGSVDVPVHTAPVPTARIMRGWIVTSVRAPVDDRRLVVSLSRPGRFKGSVEKRATLTISAVPTARGAELRDAGGAVLASVGRVSPAPVAPRAELSDDAVAAAARAGDATRLLSGRWVSAPVARWLLGDPDHAVARYRMLCTTVDATPARCGGEVLPFPMCDAAQPVASLIAPLDVAPSSRAGSSRGEAARESRADRARRRMETELERAREAPHLRAAADALIARPDGGVPVVIRLADGSEVRTDARPDESASDVAERLHARARSMERALERLPARLAALESGSRAPEAPARPTKRAPVPASPRLPFRTYRSSGGRDIWVGRGAASNDALTFHHATPGDVWLHARDAAGAHVVLRWSRDEPPPARDLEEAAQLAAWHSKARGSRVVPVDWTRRKHVRKPRGGAPGLVLVQRVKTIFARPDAALERALRYDPASGVNG